MVLPTAIQAKNYILPLFDMEELPSNLEECLENSFPEQKDKKAVMTALNIFSKSKFNSAQETVDFWGNPLKNLPKLSEVCTKTEKKMIEKIESKGIGKEILAKITSIWKNICETLFGVTASSLGRAIKKIHAEGVEARKKIFDLDKEIDAFSEAFSKKLQEWSQVKQLEKKLIELLSTVEDTFNELKSDQQAEKILKDERLKTFLSNIALPVSEFLNDLSAEKFKEYVEKVSSAFSSWAETKNDNSDSETSDGSNTFSTKKQSRIKPKIILKDYEVKREVERILFFLKTYFVGQVYMNGFIEGQKGLSMNEAKSLLNKKVKLLEALTAKYEGV